MQKVTIRGVALHYLQAGRGPDLVMLHGLASDLSFWYLRVLPWLTGSWRVTLYDQRGHGLSEVAPSGYTTAELADDLLGLLDFLGIECPHLVGHSFGGSVALHHAMLRPDRARSLALVDCRVPALQPLPPGDDSQQWGARREALRAAGVDVSEETPKVLYPLFEELVALERESEDGAGGARCSTPWKPGVRALRRLTRLRGTTLPRDVYEHAGLDERAIGTVMLPTLLAFGELSRSLDTCRALEKLLPNHRTVIHPGVGHFFPSTRPELVIEDVRTFLGEVEAGERHSARGEVLS